MFNVHTDLTCACARNMDMNYTLDEPLEQTY
jgi:hypothetical protein